MNTQTDATNQMLFEVKKAIENLEKSELNDFTILRINTLATSVLALQTTATLRSLSDSAAEVAAKTQMFELFMARYFAGSLNAKKEFESFSEVCLRAATASKDPERYEATERSLARLDEFWQLMESSETQSLIGENYS